MKSAAIFRTNPDPALSTPTPCKSSRTRQFSEVKTLLVPYTVCVLNADLIAKQHFGTTALPAAVSGRRKHEAASWVNIDRGDNSTAMTRDDRKGDSAVASGIGLSDIIDAENVV